MALFVAIEGVDGAGTTTQVKLLAQALSALGLPVHCTREPSDNPIGLHIRSLLSATERVVDERAMALMFAADRLDHLQREVRPALQRGAIVLSDRYLMSSLAYQGELLGMPQDGGWVSSINAQAPAADLTVLVRVTAELAAARRAARGGPVERYDAQQLQARLVERYDHLAETLPGCAVVDGALAPERVCELITGLIQTRLAP